MVELRYFGGLSIEECAQILGIAGANRKARLGVGARLASPGDRTGRIRMSPELWGTRQGRCITDALEKDPAEVTIFAG